jgi:hypothetical protein
MLIVRGKPSRDVTAASKLSSRRVSARFAKILFNSSGIFIRDLTVEEMNS